MKINRLVLLASLVIAGCSSIAVGYRWLSFWKHSVTEQTIGLGVLTGIFTLGVWILICRFGFPRISSFTPRAKFILAFIAFALGIFLTLVIPLSELPWRSLEIIATGKKNPQSTSSSVLLWSMYRVDGWHIARSEYTLTGEWQTGEQSAIYSVNDQRAVMRWQDTTNQPINLDLLKQSDAGIVLIRWDSTEQQFDLYSPENVGKLMTLTLRSTRWQDRSIGYNLCALTFHLIDGVALGFWLWLGLTWLLTRQSSFKPLSDKLWLGYAVALMGAWSVYLFAFFPGLMSLDSLSQWKQALGLEQVSDWHSPLYTGIIWVMTHIWVSPAGIALIQIVTTSFLLAYGLHLLEQAGIPRRVTASLCLAAIIVPLNGVMLITLWKDIPFSIGVLALTVLVLKNMLDPMPLEGTSFWISIGILCAFLNLARQNGFVIGIGFPLVLLIVTLVQSIRHRTEWQQALKPASTLVIALGIFGFVQGPIYDSLGVIKTPSQGIMALAYPILAQTKSGSQITESDQAIVRSALAFQASTSSDEMNQTIIRILQVLGTVLARNPGATLEYWYSTSGLVWQITKSPTQVLRVTMVEGDLIEKNTIDLEPSRFIPQFTDWMTSCVRRTLVPRIIVIWRAAPYLYLSLAGIIIGAWRNKNKMWFVVGLPIILHAFGMIFSSVNQEVRYVYPIQLDAFLLSGLLFLPQKDKSLDSDTSKSHRA
jgi:hypothetical protein